mmetsp:Transcript_3996/g.11831  ORF Transcript_3996/g.11831 Transcript_3996/m.11831 type:complete len:490 (+) Transcript_3996:137-1606(+)
MGQNLSSTALCKSETTVAKAQILDREMLSPKMSKLNTTTAPLKPRRASNSTETAPQTEDDSASEDEETHTKESISQEPLIEEEELNSRTTTPRTVAAATPRATDLMSPRTPRTGEEGTPLEGEAELSPEAVAALVDIPGGALISDSNTFVDSPGKSVDVRTPRFAVDAVSAAAPATEGHDADVESCHEDASPSAQVVTDDPAPTIAGDCAEVESEPPADAAPADEQPEATDGGPPHPESTEAENASLAPVEEAQAAADEEPAPAEAPFEAEEKAGNAHAPDAPEETSPAPVAATPANAKSPEPSVHAFVQLKAAPKASAKPAAESNVRASTVASSEARSGARANWQRALKQTPTRVGDPGYSSSALPIPVLTWAREVTGTQLPDSAVADLDGAHAFLRDGVLLCELAEKILPGSIPSIERNAFPFAHRQNIGNFLKSAAQAGVKAHELFHVEELVGLHPGLCGALEKIANVLAVGEGESVAFDGGDAAW